jgi:hypothetical protein
MPASARRTTIIASSIALGVIGVVVAANMGGGTPVANPTPTPTFVQPSPTCIDAPGRAAKPAWFPKDLPMPDGFYATTLPVPGQTPKGYKQAIFVVPGALKDWVNHVLTTWPAAGWEMGPGDSEFGEAEASFARPATRKFGAFRANSALCDQRTTLVYLVFGDLPGVTLTPTASGTPLARQP